MKATKKWGYCFWSTAFMFLFTPQVSRANICFIDNVECLAPYVLPNGQTSTEPKKEWSAKRGYIYARNNTITFAFMFDDESMQTLKRQPVIGRSFGLEVELVEKNGHRLLLDRIDSNLPNSSNSERDTNASDWATNSGGDNVNALLVKNPENLTPYQWYQISFVFRNNILDGGITIQPNLVIDLDVVSIFNLRNSFSFLMLPAIYSIPETFDYFSLETDRYYQFTAYPDGREMLYWKEKPNSIVTQCNPNQDQNYLINGLSKVGMYSWGWNTNGSSEAIWNAYVDNGGYFKVGVPFQDTGGNIYVHDWNGIIIQNFQNTNVNNRYGTDGQTALIYNSYVQKCYLVKEGFRGYYKQNNGPVNFGAPYTDEITARLANSTDGAEAALGVVGTNVVGQKFGDPDGARHTLMYSSATGYVGHLPMGLFHIGEPNQSGEQWYIMANNNPIHDKPWPAANHPAPTGKWWTAAGIYQFCVHNLDGSRRGGGVTVTIGEGNEQSAEPEGNLVATPTPPGVIGGAHPNPQQPGLSVDYRYTGTGNEVELQFIAGSPSITLKGAIEHSNNNDPFTQIDLTPLPPGNQNRFIGRYEISEAQFACFAPAFQYYYTGGNEALRWVTQTEARAFCAWLNQYLHSTGYHCRLPTANEWAEVARAGINTDRFWQPNSSVPLYEEQFIAERYARCRFYNTTPAQAFPVNDRARDFNPWGLKFVLTNVSEWVDETGQVYGGNYNDMFYDVYPRLKYQTSPDSRSELVGFRILVETYADPTPTPTRTPIPANTPTSTPTLAVPLTPTPTPTPPAQLTITLPGAATLQFKRVSGGTFVMGRSGSNVPREEKPQHAVTICYGFYILEQPVKQGQFKALMGYEPIQRRIDNEPNMSSTARDRFRQLVGADKPVVLLNGYAMLEFIGKLNQLGQGTFRLPSEAEWEYSLTTQGIGFTSFQSPFGAVRLWELCFDDWHNNYSGAPTDGSAWVNNPRASTRVIRTNCEGWRTSRQDARMGSDGDDSLGFRLARE